MALRDSLLSAAGRASGALSSALTLGGEYARAAQGRLVAKPSVAQAPRPLSVQLLRLGPQRPSEVSAIMRQADTGFMYHLCDLFEEARSRDCHLDGVMFRRENAPAATPWQIVPASERPKALRVAAFVEDALRNLGEQPIDGVDLKDLAVLITHLNAAVGPGYAGSEMVWRKNGRYVVPAGALPMGSRRFIFSQLDASLRWWDAQDAKTPYPGVDVLADYVPGRFLIHRPRQNGATGPREGMIRPLTWAAVYRTWAEGDWLRTGEMAWKPYRWGTYERADATEDIAALDAALEQLVTMGWARVPKSTDLRIEYAKGNNSAGLHQALAAFLAAEMSKRVLGATLTVEAGDKGARALGSVHADVAHEILDMDCRALEGTIRRHLIAPLVRFNFGVNTPIPAFRFLTDESADLTALSQALERIVGKDGSLMDVGQGWARAAFGIPDPLPGELLMGGRIYQPPEAKPAPAPAAPDPAEDEGGGEGPVELVSQAAMTRMLHVYRVDRLLHDPALAHLRTRMGLPANMTRAAEAA